MFEAKSAPARTVFLLIRRPEVVLWGKKRRVVDRRQRFAAEYFYRPRS